MLEIIAQMNEVGRYFPSKTEFDISFRSSCTEVAINIAHKLLAFLSYLRLSIYMSVVSIAIIMSFHLKHQPSSLELKMSFPLGIVFWTLGMACLALGFGNYVKTVTKYSRRMALVQTGWKTQVVSSIYHVSKTETDVKARAVDHIQIFTIIAISIVGVCVLFLSTNSTKDGT